MDHSHSPPRRPWAPPHFSKRHGGRLAPWLLGLCVWTQAAAVGAQTCPEGRECNYVPALPPRWADAQIDMKCSLVFGSPDGPNTVGYKSSDYMVNDFGLGAQHVAFRANPAGINIASAFDRVEQKGLFAWTAQGFVFAAQLATSSRGSFLARIRSQTSGLGTRFRLASFSMGASAGDDAGYDWVSIYAPHAATVTAELPEAQYAAYVAERPGEAFWTYGPGRKISVPLPDQGTVVLRTVGAKRLAGAQKFSFDGALITADAPISVETGGRGWALDGAGAPVNAKGGGDGLVPIEHLGKQYIVRDYPATLHQEVRLTTDTDDTVVRLNGQYLATLQAGETHVMATPVGISFIEATHNLVVMQTAGLFGGYNDMALVSPVSFADVKEMNVPLDILPGNIGELFVVMPTQAIASLTFNETSIEAQNDVAIESVPGHPEWTAATIRNLISGYYNLHAHADMIVAVATGNLDPGSGVFVYLSRLRRPLCGNGVLDPMEECDDGNIASFDGCSSMCHVEAKYTCSGEPSVCARVAQSVIDDPTGPYDDMAPGAALDCAHVGCPSGQWCSSTGCLPAVTQGEPCLADQQCLHQLCASDGRCGLPAGDVCAQHESCRSLVCSDAHCVSVSASGQGTGWFACSMTGAPSGIDAGMILAGAGALGLVFTRRARARRVGL